jgi:hypothetical protein
MTDNLNEADAEPKRQFPMNHKLLLSLVIGMGVMIVVGVVALGVAMTQRGASKTAQVPAAVSGPVTQTVPPLAAPASINFGEHIISLPSGFTLKEFNSDGHRLLIRLSSDTGDTAIWLVDLASGQVVGRYQIQAAD